jgi:hypothetical protein
MSLELTSTIITLQKHVEEFKNDIESGQRNIMLSPANPVRPSLLHIRAHT